MTAPASAATSTTQPIALPLQSIHVTLIRHGQSVDNLNGIWAGHKDSPLTSTGVAQAKALSRAFADVHLDAIYSSDLKRASQTAHELVNQNQTSPPPPLVQTQSLREQYFGTAEGRDVTEAQASNPSHPDNARDAAFPSGETLAAVNARLATAVRRFILPRLEGLRTRKSTDPDSGIPHVCIVAHGIAIAELLRVFMSSHQSASEYAEPWSHPQLTYQRARLDNTGWTRLQLSVPAADATPSNTTPSPTRPIFVRFVGQQNNIAHLHDIAAPASATALATKRMSQYPHPTQVDRQPSPNSDYHPAASTSTLNPYSAGYMSQAMSSGHSGRDAFSREGPLSTALSHYYSSGAAQAPFRTPHDPGLSGFLSAYQIPHGHNTSPPTGTTHSPNSLRPLHFPNLLSPSRPTPTPSSNTELWKNIVSRVLPIFKGDALRGSIEDVNDLVSQHIRHTLDRGPARAWSALSNDLRTLLMTGMLTLDSRIVGSATTSDDASLLVKLATCWTVFVSIVLPWVEASFLPLGTDPILLSLASAIGSGASGATNGPSSTAHLTSPAPPTSSTSPAVGGSNTNSNASSHLQLPPSAMASSAASSSSTPGPASTLVALSSSQSVPTLAAATPVGGQPTPASVTASPPPLPPSAPSGTTPNLNGIGPTPTATPAPSLLRSQRIDVRKVSLTIFRDSVLLPNFERLFYLFARIAEVPLSGAPGAGGPAPTSTSNAAGLGLGLGLGLESTPQNSGSSRNRPTPAAGGSAAAQSEEDSSSAQAICHRLTQMTHRVRSVQSGDEAQQATDALLRALRVGIAATSETGETTTHIASVNAPVNLNVNPHGNPNPTATPTMTPAVSLSSINHHLNSLTMDSQQARVVNRRGWMPRAAAKHGVHAQYSSGGDGEYATASDPEHHPGSSSATTTAPSTSDTQMVGTASIDGQDSHDGDGGGGGEGIAPVLSGSIPSSAPPLQS